MNTSKKKQGLLYNLHLLLVFVCLFVYVVQLNMQHRFCVFLWKTFCFLYKYVNNIQ